MKLVVAALTAVAALLPAPLIAQQQARFGSWSVEKNGEYLEMHTRNDSGSGMGVICTMDDRCIVYVSSTAGCNDGENYPGLLSTDKGAVSVSLRCGNIGGRPTVAVEPFGTALDLLKRASSWAIAAPLSRGGFESYSFTPRSTDQAWSAMQNIFRLTSGRGSNRNSNF